MTVLLKYATPRALRNREQRSDDRAVADDPRSLGGLPLARFVHTLIKRRESPAAGMSVLDAAEHLGYLGLASDLSGLHREVYALIEGAGETPEPPPAYQESFINSLDHLTAVRSLIPEENKIYSTRDDVQFPEVGGVTAEMVRPSPLASEAPPTATPGLPQVIHTGSRALHARKMRVEVLCSRSLLRASNADLIIYKVMADAAARCEDRLLVEGKGTEYEFRGLRNLAEGALKSAASPVNYANVRGDLRAMLRAMADNKVPAASGRAFVGAQQHRDGLEDLESPVGVCPFGDSLDERGTLLGKPAAFSTAIATDAFFCFAPGEALYFERLNMGIELDNTYTDADGRAYSASGQDAVLFRLFRSLDFALKHPEACEYLSNVTWGA